MLKSRTEHSVSQSLSASIIETLEARRLLASTLVPVVSQDLVYDAVRNDLCITTSSGKVQRYDLDSGALLSSIAAGTNLLGADITVDGKYLYVNDGGANIIRKVDLATGAVSNLPYTASYGEGYGFDLKILSNGKAYFTGQYNGSGWVTFRQIDLSTDAISTFPRQIDLRQSAPLARSTDRNALFWQEPNTSDGPIALYDAPTDKIVARRSTSQFLGGWEAVSRDGSLMAMRLGGTLTILDRSLNNVRTLSNITGAYTFDAQRDVFYGVDTTTDQIIAYDTKNWQEYYRLTADENLSSSNSRFGQSMVVSSDSTRVFMATPTGVRIFSLPQPTGNAALVRVEGFPTFTGINVQGTFTVRLLDQAGTPATNFRGTIHFTSTDPSAILPADYTFTAADGGTHSFTATFKTIGVQTLTATAVGGSLAGSEAGIDVHEAGRALVPVLSQDLIYDPVRNDLYMTTSSGKIERYDLDTGTLLSPITAGASLLGGDITANGNFLYINDGGANVIRKVDLSTGAVTNLPYTPDYGDGYGYDLKILSDNRAYFTGRYDGSGWVDLRRIDLSTDTISTYSSLRQDAPLARSADRNALFWQEPNTSDGPIALYDAPSGTVVARRSTSQFLGGWEAVNRTGTLVAMRLGGTLTILDRALNNVRTLNNITGAYAFDPQRDVFYGVDATTDQIVAYNTSTWQEYYRLAIGENLGAGNSRFGQAMVVNTDSTRLFLATPTGVRVFSLPQPTGNAVQLGVEGFPTFVGVNVQGTFTVRLLDQAGTPAVNFRGTIHFTSSDPSAILPADYTFTAADAGTHSFAATFKTIGVQTLTATVVGGSLSGSETGIDVHEPGRALLPVLSKDLVYDPVRNDLYLTTSSGKIERYDLDTGTLLGSIPAGVSLLGGDITADGNYLYVNDGGANIIRKVDLTTGVVTSLPYAPDYGEGYGYDLKILSNGKAYFTGQYNGSGSVDFRQIDLATDAIGPFPRKSSICQSAPLVRSADRNSLFWQEPNISSGPIGLYDALSDTIISQRSTSQFLGGWQAVNRDGTLVAMKLNGTLTILNRSLDNIRTLSNITGAYAFDPHREVFYGVDATSDQVVAYDTVTWQEYYRLTIGENLSAGNSRFGQAMVISSDSTRLFLATPTGVRVLTLPQPTGNASLVRVEGFPTFTGVGIQGTFAVRLLDQAGTPATNFRGTIHFTSTDPSAILPADYTFTAADAGAHSFSATFKTIGVHTLTATVVGGSLTGSEAGIDVHEAGRALVPVLSQDIIYDPVRNDLYMTTSSGKIERYDLDTGTLLSPITVGIGLLGCDITANGDYLYVNDGGANAIRKIDLSSGAITSLPYSAAYGEGYGYDLKILSNGKAYFSGQFNGSGWVAFRQIDLSTDTISIFPRQDDLRQSAPLARSADRNSLLWQEPNISSGPIGLYDAVTDTVISRRDTNQFLGEWQAVSRDGNLIAMRLTAGLTIMDRSLSTLRTLSNITGAYAFDPRRDLFYGVDATADQIVVYDTTTWQERYRFAIGENLSSGNDRFGQAMVVSSDSAHLFLATPTGVRVFALRSATPADIALSATSVVENARVGTSVGTFSTTDPDPGDTFTYTLVSGAGADDNASFVMRNNILQTTASFDYETKGSYSIRVRTTDSVGLWIEKAFTIQVTDVDDTAPVVTSFSINDGAVQRSMVRKLSVTFSEPVTLAADALTAKLSTGQLIPNTTIALTNPSADQRTYILTFSGSAVIGGSLADGIYDLIASASGIQDLAGNVMTADFSQRFHRLFGDSDGNRIVNALDYARLKQTFGRAPTDPLFNSAFDYEGNTLINALDLARFRQRYGLSFSY